MSDDQTVEAARRTLLDDYGYHDSGCEIGPSWGVFCTCAYPTAVRAFEEAVREDEHASESALRAAAQELKAIWDEPLDPRVDESETDPQLRFAARWQQYQRLDAATQKLIAALDGAPFEPSEEMVERAASAMREANDPGRTLTPAVERAAMSFYVLMARAALKAALSPPPAGPPASA